MTTPDDQPNADNGRRRRDHPRPARFSSEVRLPLAIRKELLLTRAALERHDFAQSLREVRGGARRAISVTSWINRMTHLTKPSSWMGLLGLTKRYPIVSTAVTLALPLLKRVPLGRITWRVSKLGLLAGAGYWAYKTWTDASHQAVGPVVVTTQPVPPASAADTFHDPLVP